MVLNRDRNLYLPLAAKLLCQQLAIQQYSRCHQHDSILCVFDSLKLSACDDASGTTTTLGEKSLENSHSASSLDFFYGYFLLHYQIASHIFWCGRPGFSGLDYYPLIVETNASAVAYQTTQQLHVTGLSTFRKSIILYFPKQGFKTTSYVSTKVHPKYVLGVSFHVHSEVLRPNFIVVTF